METKMTEVEERRFKLLQKVYETWLPPPNTSTKKQ